MREEILKQITDNPNPLKVNLSGMQIQDNEILEIVQIITHIRPNIVTIDLDNNSIGDKGATILSEFIRSLEDTKAISLQYNIIGKKGALGLFGLKKYFPELDILLHGNKIIDAGEMDEIEHLATTVEILPITEEDITGFWSALDSVARERQYLAFLEGPPINTTRDFVLDNIKNNWPHFVAVCAGRIIGWCDIGALDRPVFAHVGSLGIGLLAPYRGLGIGEQLLQTAIQKAEEKGLTRIELTVREKNKPAIALYKKLGFEIEGIHKNGVCIEGKYENHIFMALLLGDAKN